VRLLANAGYPAAALEPSSGRREILDARLANLPNYLGAVDRPDADEPFDVAFAFEVIEHIPDEGLSHFFAVLRGFLSDEGVLILSTPCRENLPASAVYSPITGAVFHRWQHVQQWTPKSLRDIVEANGFVVEVIHEVDLYGISQGRHPYFEVLLRSPQGLTLGDGSNLICIARKVVDNHERPSSAHP
jgi:hypothetical protein